MPSVHRHSFYTSLRFRLTLTYGAVFAVCLLAVFALLGATLRQAALGETDAVLVSEARRLLDLSARRKPAILQSEVERYVRHHGPDTVSVILRSAGGGLIAAAGADAGADVSAATEGAPPEVPVFRSERRGSTTVRGVLLTRPGGHTIRMTRSQAEFAGALRFSARALAAGFAASLVLGTALAYLVARRAAERIESVRRTAEAIAADNLSLRVPETAGADEIAALAVTFNHMLERIESALAQVRTVTDSVAHDFRTPLTRIRGAAEAALCSPAPAARAAETLPLIIDECDRLHRMVSTMLQIVRMDAGAVACCRETVELAACAAEAVELFTPAFEDRGVALSCASLPPHAAVAADRALLDRVLANLLDNAMKFTPSGGRVTLTAAAEGDRWLLRIEDTGDGISAKDLTRVFDRFYRSDRARSQDGCGLGLSFVQSAVRLMGGEVTVESAPGRGSAFTVALPAASAA